MKELPMILASLIASRDIIVVEDRVYVGFTPDGRDVHIGVVGEEVRIERYLVDHPTPADW